MNFSFEIKHAEADSLARVGTISTPHGQIQTPAFIPVGTKATVKAVLPEAMADLGAQVTVIGVGFRGNARSYETFTCRFLAFGTAEPP